MRYSTSRRQPFLTNVFCRSLLVVATGFAFSSGASAQSDTYYAEASTQMRVDYPGTATIFQDLSNQSSGIDPQQTYSSTTSLGFVTAPGVQAAYSYARPGSLGVLAHGQSAPYTQDGPTGDEESVSAKAYTIDVLQVPRSASGLVDIRFSIPTDVVDASYAYDPSNFGPVGRYGLQVSYDSEIEVFDLTSGGGGFSSLHVQSSSDGLGFETVGSGQPFIFTAHPGDQLRVYTLGQAGGVTGRQNQYFNVDLSHTIRTYADVLTPGVTLTSLSGHDYSTPAPEPPQWAALGMGTLGLGGMALRARRRANA